MKFLSGLFILIGFCFSIPLGYAQTRADSVQVFYHAFRRLQIGASFGGMNYFGDLSQDLKTLALTRPGMGLQIRYQFNDVFSLRLAGQWGQIQGDDRMGRNSAFNWQRGLSFRSNITEIQLSGIIHLLHGKRQVRPYLTLGVGIFHFNPKADLFLGSVDYNNRYQFSPDGLVLNASGEQVTRDGKYETSLYDWKTEGFDNGLTRFPSTYKLWQVQVPLGIGVRIGLSPRVDLNLEWGMRYLFSDYIDDVSSRYASSNLIQQNFSNPQDQAVAAYISNPTGKVSAYRGNELKNDTYTYTSIGFAYRVGRIVVPRSLVTAPYKSEFCSVWTFGMGTGILLLQGDMRDHTIAPAVNNGADPNSSDIKPAGAVFVERRLSPYFRLRADIIAGTISGTRQPEYFTTPIYDGSLSLILNISETFPRFKPYRRRAELFAMAGVGRNTVIPSVRNVNSGITTRYLGNKAYNTLPIGAGVKIHLGHALDLEAMYSYRYVNSDGFDATLSLPFQRKVINTVKDGYSWISVSLAWNLLQPVKPKGDPFRGLKRKVLDVLKHDIDQDGVPDYKDQDSGTPPGIPVNHLGKPFDRDQDSVPDLNDRDPFTPKGLSVDADGMPADNDGDGVPNYRDLEPDSPPGSQVNFKGLSFFGEENSLDTLAEIEALKPLLGTWNFMLIYFDFDKAYIKNEYEDGLQQLALLLTKMPELSIKLIGHADIRGNRDYNIKLSERRAKAVKSILTDSYSIDPTRFYIEYKGKDSPHTEHISQAAQGSNRRVEIRLMYKGKEITE